MPSLSSRQTGHRESQQLQAPRPATWPQHFPGTDYVAEDRRAVLIRELEVSTRWQCLGMTLHVWSVPTEPEFPGPNVIVSMVLRTTFNVQRFFATDAGWEILSVLQLHGSRAVLQLDFAQLHAQTGSGDLAAAMQYQPVEALGCVAAAVYEVDRPRLLCMPRSDTSPAMLPCRRMHATPVCSMHW